MALISRAGSFMGCSNLAKIDFDVLEEMQGADFYRCSALTAVIIRSPAVCTMSDSNAFASTPIKSGTGYIYVPAALVDSYKAETNWSTYAAQFRALEDYTVDGTITGELDPAKTGT